MNILKIKNWWINQKKKITIEEVTLSKPDGTAVFLPVDPSNVMIIDADMDDDRRIKNVTGDN